MILAFVWYEVFNSSEEIKIRDSFLEISEVKERKRRHSTDRYNQEFYNLSGDVFDMEYPEAERLILYDENDNVSSEYNDTIMEQLTVDADAEEIDYFSGSTWHRSTSSKYNSKIII